MITYSKEELVSISELSQHLADFLQRLHSQQHSKIAVVNNNRPEAVLMSIEEYERLQGAYELLEHLEIYQTIKQRESTSSNEYISHAAMLQQFEVQ